MTTTIPAERCRCPHAVVEVIHGVPCIINPACGEEDCVSEGCRKMAQKKRNDEDRHHAFPLRF